MQEKITARKVVYHRAVGGIKVGAVGFLSAIVVLDENVAQRRNTETLRCAQNDDVLELPDEVYFGFVWDDAADVAHFQKLADGFAAVCAVVQGAFVDVHADEAVR